MSVISAGTTLTTALVQTGDTNGNLVFRTGASGTTALTLGSDQSATFAGAVSFSGGAFAAGSAAAPSITFTGDTNTGIFSPAADTIAFSEGGVESMRIDSVGNVGIGTSSPAENLTVNGASRGAILATGGTVANYFTADSSNSAGFVGTGSAHPLGFITSAIERMRIDSSGNVGIGTSSPDVRLSVQSTIGLKRSSDGVTVGALVGNTNDFTLSAGVGTMVFSTAGSERMRLDASGNLLVGTTSTGSEIGRLTIKQAFDADNGGLRLIAPNSSNAWAIRTGSDNNLYFGYNGASRASISNSTGNYNALSDARLKTGITDSVKGLSVIIALRPVEYQMKDDATSSNQVGFIAQEVLEVLPEVVSIPASDDFFYGMNYAGIVPVLVKAIQEQQAIITDQASTIAAFEARLTALENK